MSQSTRGLLCFISNGLVAGQSARLWKQIWMSQISVGCFAMDSQLMEYDSQLERSLFMFVALKIGIQVTGCSWHSDPTRNRMKQPNLLVEAEFLLVADLSLR